MRELLERLELTEAKRPGKSQVDKLIELFGKVLGGQKHNAPIKVQQQFHDKFYAAVARLQKKYPDVDFSSDEFFSQMEARGRAWLSKQAFFGAGRDW